MAGAFFGCWYGIGTVLYDFFMELTALTTAMWCPVMPVGDGLVEVLCEAAEEWEGVQQPKSKAWQKVRVWMVFLTAKEGPEAQVWGGAQGAWGMVEAGVGRGAGKEAH